MLALWSCLGLACGATAQELSTCKLPDIAQEARCGTIEVPENWQRPEGRKLGIAVAVLPATEPKALPDPIVFLMGGPGEDAISAASVFAKWYEQARRDRDLVFIDQRGTGKSHRLACDIYAGIDVETLFRDVFPLAPIEQCARDLSKIADLTQYTYGNFIRDLEHIRLKLGYGPMNLSAGSYGTRPAQFFIRAYPQSVRTVFFHSIVPIDVAIPLPMSKAAQTAMDRVLNDCQAQPKCRAAFPNVRDELTEVLRRLETQEVKVAIPGEAKQVRLHRGRVAERLRSMMYREEGADRIPLVIHRMYLGDYDDVVEDILENARGASTAISFGLFFSIGCNEDVPFIRESQIGPATAGAYLGEYRVRQQQAACSKWPKVSLPADYREPIRSTVPALFVSGDTDPASPLWFAAHAAKGFPNRAEVVLGNRGHTEWRPCVGEIYRRFLGSGTAQGLDASTCKPEPRRPFETPSEG